jgi:hypothetical protein
MRPLEAYFRIRQVRLAVLGVPELVMARMAERHESMFGMRMMVRGGKNR